ncbi:hypothetical protein QVD99_004520 [Batrachochytrium dendrobatidis]|nr:hypothetical protein O5D80_002755 [Batrachochytrium dendrobatidis]KAK5668691.1 hypothetical protein QVD99_004485 [Batrachochytrium dendrobatidis]KAK5668725.1 hypothetical protein QVD99_004520 [Batrachochytrium dendrobatidis]
MDCLIEEQAVGGIPITIVRSCVDQHLQQSDVAVLFLLHGRKEPIKRYVEHAKTLVNAMTKQDNARSLGLVVVLFEQRNHGSRLVSAVANESWSTGNPTHATDMWSIQYGTAKDVSFLMDVLPMHLSATMSVHRWGVAGVSLGGHSTLLAAVHEPRLDVAVSIIGCGDYASLMVPRAQASGLSISAESCECFPSSLVQILTRLDPVNNVHKLDNQKLLILGGGLDAMVPPSANKMFIDRVRERYGAEGKSEWFDERIDPDAGHTFSPWMMVQTQQWLCKYLLSR